jgi:hypothetical protein
MSAGRPASCFASLAYGISAHTKPSAPKAVASFFYGSTWPLTVRPLTLGLALHRLSSFGDELLVEGNGSGSAELRQLVTGELS